MTTSRSEASTATRARAKEPVEARWAKPRSREYLYLVHPKKESRKQKSAPSTEQPFVSYSFSFPVDRKAAQAWWKALGVLAWTPSVSGVAALLNARQGAASDAERAELATQLEQWLRPPDRRMQLSEWLSDQGQIWARERRPALAPVLEVMARHRIEGAEDLFLAVLSNAPSNSGPATVAAQRVRLLAPLTTHRAAMWDGLRAHIEAWEKSEGDRERSLLALPSIPCVADARTTCMWLGTRIEKGPAATAWAASQAVIDWASGTSRGAASPTESQGAELTRAILARLRGSTEPSPEVPGLIPALIWALGGVAPPAMLTEAAVMVVGALAEPKGFEDAAAVRSAAMLVRRFESKAVSALQAACGGDVARYNRLVSLMIAVR